MTPIENADFIRANINFCRPKALERIIKIIEKEYEHYDDKECFMLHEEIDNFFYYVYYKDGSRHMEYIGRKAYLKYVENDDAVKIERKTKDLFPTFELLAEKH